MDAMEEHELRHLMEKYKGRVVKTAIQNCGWGYHDEPNVVLFLMDENGNKLGFVLLRDCEVDEVKDDTAAYLMENYGLPLE